MAGHSKWANIQHRKGRQDAKRGKVFTRLIKEITVASRLGGPDAGSNARLRLAVVNERRGVSAAIGSQRCRMVFVKKFAYCCLSRRSSLQIGFASSAGFEDI